MRIADHWQQALDNALQLVDGKAAQDRIGVVMIDDEAELLSDLTSSTDILHSVLRNQSPGFKKTRLALAIEQAARLLTGSNASRKRIFVISDFQASAVSTVARIGTDIELIALPVEVTLATNASITSVAIEPSPNTASGGFSMNVEVTNRATSPLEQEVTLKLDGRELARRRLLLPAGSTVTETFDQLSVSGDLLRGIVSLSEDALALDNRHFFVYSSKQQLPLLIVEGDNARANQSVFLHNALGLSRNPAFRVERMAIKALKAEDLPSRAVIILNDVSLPAGALADELAEFVTRGGGLLVVTATAAQQHWPTDLLPGNPGRRVEAKQATAYNLTDFEPDHPLSFDLGERDAIDLSLARVFGYRELKPGANGRVVARYSDGGAALVERQVGQGRVLVLTTTLDTHWNDIVLQPAFLPFLHRSLRYLSAYEPYPNQSEIGTITDLKRYARALAGSEALSASASDGPLVVESPEAGEIRVSRQSPLLTLSAPGFYQVHHAAKPGVEITLAANVDPHEANQEILDVARFVEEIMASADSANTGTPLGERQAAKQEQQQQLAHAILIAVLVLMLVEALSANWIGIRQSMRPRETA
jgi:hypothetical protein